ncbi:MAG: hypothetical protein DRJ03_07350 [Chloroflexi bacterium]|nr:MAG: hypothetical protein DRJ03_07350 [Chloroflexota bacterium]
MGIYDVEYPKTLDDCRGEIYDKWHSATWRGIAKKGMRIFHRKDLAAGVSRLEFFNVKPDNRFAANYQGAQSLVDVREFLVVHGVMLRVLPDSTNWMVLYRNWMEIAEGLMELKVGDKTIIVERLRQIMDPLRYVPRHAPHMDIAVPDLYWQFTSVDIASHDKRDYWPIIPTLVIPGQKKTTVTLE